MELQLRAEAEGGPTTLDVSDAVFGRDFNEALVHQAVTAFMAGGRSGTKAQKNRAAVSGGGAKPWRQKGTGRARAGTSRSPVWVGGGVTFAAVPRDYTQKLNKKMYRAALRSVLSELARRDRLQVVDSLTVDEPKTKRLVERLRDLGVENALIITDELDTNLYLSARNLVDIEVIDVKGVNPVSLLRRSMVVMTKAALRQVEEWLG